MPRSSGQSATPRRAMRSEVKPTVSRPSKFAEPERLPTMPMIDFRVVVLPAPLRPSRVTTSPGRTSKSTPCRMCDSPYQACKPSTLSCASAILDTEIGALHLGVLRHGRVIALSQNAPPRQHGDAVGEMLDHPQIVLDH